MTYFVYVLQSKKDNNYYIGQTNDIEKRLSQHFNGHVLSTKNRRPLRVVGYKIYQTRSEAMWIEHTLKMHGDKKKKFIDSLYKEKGLRPVGPLARREVNI